MVITNIFSIYPRQYTQKIFATHIPVLRNMSFVSEAQAGDNNQEAIPVNQYFNLGQDNL